MIPTEIITLFGGSITGFLFKFLAFKSKQSAEQTELLIKRGEQTIKSHDAAANRDKDTGGMWVRRIIVLSVLFGVILAPFIATLLSIPVIMEISITNPIFFGLLGNKTEKFFVEATGYVMVPEIRQALTAIIGFYFGQATVK